MPFSTSSRVLCFVGVGRRSSGVGVGSEGEVVLLIDGASGEVSLVSPVGGVVVSVAAFLAARRARLRDIFDVFTLTIFALASTG